MLSSGIPLDLSPVSTNKDGSSESPFPEGKAWKTLEGFSELKTFKAKTIKRRIFEERRCSNWGPGASSPGLAPGHPSSVGRSKRAGQPRIGVHIDSARGSPGLSSLLRVRGRACPSR